MLVLYRTENSQQWDLGVSGLLDWYCRENALLLYFPRAGIAYCTEGV